MCSILKLKLTFRLNYQALKNIYKRKKEKKKSLLHEGQNFGSLLFLFFFKYKNSGPHPEKEFDAFTLSM